MVLPTLALFADVPVTRDYSVVRDCSNASQWLRELYNYAGPGESTVSNPATLVKEERVNYYRLPDKIRVEGSYDELRKVTYGALHQLEWDDYNAMWVVSSTQGYYIERPLFFWVDSVRLIKAGSKEQTYPNDDLSVVELTVTPDVWANNLGQWTLHDSFVVRRHMDRWTENSGVYSDVYYPNAAGDVEGAYNRTLSTELTPYTDLLRGDNDQPSGNKRKLRAIIVTALKKTGELEYYIGMDAVLEDGTIEYVYYSISAKPFFNLDDICDGSFYTESGLAAEFIQSIVMVPLQCIPVLFSDIRWGTVLQQVYLPAIPATAGVDIGGGTNMYYLTPSNDDVYELRSTLEAFTVSSANPYVPDTSLVTSTARAVDQEPMMYREPAVKRSLVNGIGGSITEIPDVEALEEDATVLPVTGSTGTRLHLFTGSDIFAANAKGSVGSVDAPTMPIFNSAWQSYNAISRVGDTIQYNASQAATFGSTLGNLGMSMAGGFLMGGPVGAALGAASSITGGITSAYSNKENLRAKRQVIKNSPCTVVDSGNGMGSAIKNLLSYHYVALRMDEISSGKLEEDYYWRGYFTERFYSGTISLDTREYFDFILTEGARVRGSVNAEDAAAIGSILDRGTTIVHERSFLFDPDATLNNRENSLI